LPEFGTIQAFASCPLGIGFPPPCGGTNHLPSHFLSCGKGNVNFMPDSRQMPPPPSVHVVIAAYNEASARVVADVSRSGNHLVVVDDGSADDTAVVAAAAGATVLRHPINLGQGAALQTGIDYALAAGADVVVTFDADGQHRAADIRRLIEALDREHADFALGSRFLGRSTNLPPFRRLVLIAATLFTRLTTHLHLTDTHNGLRAMTRRGAGAIRLRQNRMAHASEILTEISRSGLHYVEVPVTIEYTSYSLAKGQSIGNSVMILLDLFARKLYR
jgi:glycosyltransferase involved in cell wall biosynthesis